MFPVHNKALINTTNSINGIHIIIGIIFGFIDLIWLGIALEIIILLFQVITLPVEFNASSRAKEKLKQYNLLDTKELDGSSKMLRAAALTYVASVITTLLQVLRLVIMFTGRRND